MKTTTRAACQLKSAISPASARRPKTAAPCLRSIAPWCVSAAAALAFFFGCVGQAYWLSKYDSDIKKSTRAIETAKDDTTRAHGYVERARAYSEKARYSRSFKLVSSEEYGRLFDLSMRDHSQAIALAPYDAEVYVGRGCTWYDRAALEKTTDPRTGALFDSARVDFTRAIERDSGSEQAFDMRGLVWLHGSEYDQAIADFTMEMKINPKGGRLRLAETYCQRASAMQQAKRYDDAIADYEKTIDLGVPSDGCDCQPESPLAWLYLQKGQYDKSWDVVHRAQQSKRWIDSATVEQLKKASGRDR
jgi:tetratricopeptide (TPR) repeat protein